MEKQNSDAINEKEKWKKTSSMETTRYWLGATTIGDKIYVTGGCNNDDGHLSSAEVYDSKSNKRSPLPGMNEKRKGCAAISNRGKMYAVGGDDGRRRLSSCEMFYPDTNKWTVIPDMKEARDRCAACGIGDNLYVIGGMNVNGWLSSVEIFDCVKQKWSSLPNMTTKRVGCAAVSL